MLTEAYIEALLVNDELADQVWELWYSGAMNDLDTCLAWMMVAQISREGSKDYNWIGGTNTHRVK